MCKTLHCRNKSIGYCNTCLSRRKRERNPMRYAYDTLKFNAKRRGKYFELTFEEFKKFAVETDYIKGKGITKKSYSIDRSDNTMGYFIGNIAVRSMEFNARKRKKILNYEWCEDRQVMVASLTDNLPTCNSDNPF